LKKKIERKIKILVLRINYSQGTYEFILANRDENSLLTTFEAIVIFMAAWAKSKIG